MTVGEVIRRLCEMASVHGEDMEVVAAEPDGLGGLRRVDDLELSPSSATEVTVRLVLGEDA